MTDEQIAATAYGHGMIAGPGQNPPNEQDAIEFARAIIAQARAEWVAELQDRIRTMTRPMAGVYANRIDAFKDGFEAGRVSALATIPTKEGL